MGARMRELDWSSTILGQWEQVAAVAASLRSRHARFWLWAFVARQELARRRIPSLLTVPILGQGSRSDNLRESRQFLVGAVIGD
jgi:hypothetical protein